MRGTTKHADGPRRAAGELEGEVLATLWAAHSPLTPREVQSGLRNELAYTTVQTILTRLHDKGLVGREGKGRAYAYFATGKAAAAAGRQMAALLATGPDRNVVMQHFVNELGAEDERKLRAILRRLPRG